MNITFQKFILSIVNKHKRRFFFRLLYYRYIFRKFNVLIGPNFKPIQKVVFGVKGSIFLGNSVSIGVFNGGNYINSVCELDTRSNESVISFGNNVKVNNNLYISCYEKVIIEDDVLIGSNVSIFDYEAHDSDPINRNKIGRIGQVIIKRNVWIGSNVIILKNVFIGEGSIVASGSVVIKGTYPANSIIGGNPARVVKQIEKYIF